MPARILICDNEDPLRALVQASLERDDYEFAEARDGEEGVELARSFRPHVIVLDMMMPGRTGIDVLNELRGERELADTRVVMLTARAQAVDREAAVTAGADRFVSKPFSPLELSRVVDELLAER